MDDHEFAKLLCEDLIEGGAILELHPPHNKRQRIERLAASMEVDSLWRLSLFVKTEEEKAAYQRGIAARQAAVACDAAESHATKPGLVRRCFRLAAELLIGI